MDKPTLQILETITSYLGEALSINQLTQKIKESYGTAYYPNIHKKLQDLKKEGFLDLDIIGRSSIIKLNFHNYLLIDFLAEMEIEKKIALLKERNDLIMILEEMDKFIHGKCAIKSISSINPAKNIKLNRIELLFLLIEKTHYNEITELYKQIQKLENKYNLRIDSLILDENDFRDLIKSEEINPLREAMAEKTTIFCPQAFWYEIREISEEANIKTIRAETKPASISQSDLIYNLCRFGYKEFGFSIEQGNKYCIEYLITALLLQGNARQMEAIPIILAKNSFRSNLLAFLSQKFRTSGKLLGLLKTLQNIKPTPEIDITIDTLKMFSEEEILADEQSIMQKMRLYNAT